MKACNLSYLQDCSQCIYAQVWHDPCTQVGGTWCRFVWSFCLCCKGKSCTSCALAADERRVTSFLMTCLGSTGLAEWCYHKKEVYTKGVRTGGLGLTPPFSLIFYKTLLPAQRRLIVFAYFLLVNLST